MKKVSKIIGFNPIFEVNKTDILFDKVGLTFINLRPDNWNLNESGNKLVSKVEKDVQISIQTLCRHKVGEIILFSPHTQVLISEIKLLRLNEVPEEFASRTGVEKVGDSEWIHYSPESFFPKSILKKQNPGYPRVNNAVSSFQTLWVKKYKFEEIIINPWIWQYTCKPI